MKFVTIRDFRARSAEIQRDLPKYSELILTSNGKPIAIMAAVNEASLEESLSAIRRARAIAAVMKLQLKSVRSGKYATRAFEIEQEIKAVRRLRPKS